MILQQPTAFRPFMGHFIMLMHIARWTGYDNIFRAVRSTSCQWNNVINMVCIFGMPQFFTAIIASSFLKVILIANIFRCQLPPTGQGKTATFLFKCFATCSHFLGVIFSPLPLIEGRSFPVSFCLISCLFLCFYFRLGTIYFCMFEKARFAFRSQSIFDNIILVKVLRCGGESLMAFCTALIAFCTRFGQWGYSTYFVSAFSALISYAVFLAFIFGECFKRQKFFAFFTSLISIWKNLRKRGFSGVLPFITLICTLLARRIKSITRCTSTSKKLKCGWFVLQTLTTLLQWGILRYTIFHSKAYSLLSCLQQFAPAWGQHVVLMSILYHKLVSTNRITVYEQTI